jgi:hypothetical protein
MTVPGLGQRLLRAYREQLTKEDLARIESQFTSIDRQLGVVRSGPGRKRDPLEDLWRLPALK